jgi:hypothetical protein
VTVRFSMLSLVGLIGALVAVAWALGPWALLGTSLALLVLDIAG